MSYGTDKLSLNLVLLGVNRISMDQTNRFCNITMDGQYQMMMTQRFFYPPSNRNAKLPPDLARYAFPTEKEKNVVQIDYEKMNAHKSQYLDRWNKEVLGA